MKLSHVSWLALLGQAANLVVVVAGHSSPHTAALIGSGLTVLQAVFPSVFPGVNATAVDQHDPSR